MISQLEEDNPELFQKWEKAKTSADNTSTFIQESKRFPLSGVGDTNTYPVFTELATFELLNQHGRVGLVVKTGIATDYYTQDLFAKFVDSNRLVSLFDFVNKRNIFPDVALRERFCLLTLTGEENTVPQFEFSFFNWTLDEFREPDSRYTLTKGDIYKINPNTKNCPIFEYKEDRDVTIKIYSEAPILVDDQEGENTWSISYNTMYHMSNDSDIFADNTLENLQDQGYQLGKDGIFRNGNEKYLPLWEGKFFQQFDHRFGTFEGIPEEKRFSRRAGTKRVSSSEKQDPEYEIIPRYWVPDEEFGNLKNDLNWDQDWIFAFRETGGSASNSRTSIGTILPMHPFAHKAPVLTFTSGNRAERGVLFTTFFTSFVFDYALQQSLGGASVSYYILKQLPMPSPEEIDNWVVNSGEEEQTAREFLLDRGLQLLWTSHSLDRLGRQISDREAPYKWDENERRQLRAETDALIANLYDLTESEFEYILDSFEILKEMQEKEHGYYRRKNDCMEAFRNLEVRRVSEE